MPIIEEIVDFEGGLPLQLEVVGPKVRNGPWISWSDKAIVCGWVQNTVAPNIIWFRLLTIKWRWPPIKMATCFMERDEGD